MPIKFVDMEGWQPELSLSERLGIIKKLIEEQGQDFEQLFQAGETEKLRELLQPGQWDDFYKLWQAAMKAVRERNKEEAQKSSQQRKRELDEFVERISNLLADDAIIQGAEALRKQDRDIERTVPPFTRQGVTGDQLILLRKAEAALKPSMPAISKGQKFKPGRVKGSISDATKYIYQLVKENRNLSVKNLFPKADKYFIGDMSEGAFGNHVTQARKQYPKKKKTAK